MTELEPCPFCGNREPGLGWCVRYERDHNDLGDMVVKSKAVAGVWCPCGASVEFHMESLAHYRECQLIAIKLWNHRVVA